MLPEGVIVGTHRQPHPSQPWQAEYYMPYLDKAKYWQEHGLILWGREQGPEVVKPIIDAFAEAGWY